MLCQRHAHIQGQEDTTNGLARGLLYHLKEKGTAQTFLDNPNFKSTSEDIFS